MGDDAVHEPHLRLDYEAHMPRLQIVEPRQRRQFFAGLVDVRLHHFDLGFQLLQIAEVRDRNRREQKSNNYNETTHL
jgi:hypothetical protein